MRKSFEYLLQKAFVAIGELGIVIGVGEVCRRHWG